jgi:hypothetical protein
MALDVLLLLGKTIWMLSQGLPMVLGEKMCGNYLKKLA